MLVVFSLLVSLRVSTHRAMLPKKRRMQGTYCYLTVFQELILFVAKCHCCTRHLFRSTRDWSIGICSFDFIPILYPRFKHTLLARSSSALRSDLCYGTWQRGSNIHDTYRDSWSLFGTHYLFRIPLDWLLILPFRILVSP
jgi:hypothetical protein